MSKDYRVNQFRRNWWDMEVFLGLTRNDLSLIFLIALLAVGYISLDWDWVFGAR